MHLALLLSCASPAPSDTTAAADSALDSHGRADGDGDGGGGGDAPPAVSESWACDDGAHTATYTHLFDHRVDLEEAPDVGLWTTYDPDYVTWYRESFGVEVGAALWSPSLQVDVDGTVLATCSYVAAAGYAGFYVAEVRLVGLP
jgi:hypothetical protein